MLKLIALLALVLAPVAKADDWYSAEDRAFIYRETGIDLPEVQPVDSPLSKERREQVEAEVKSDMQDLHFYAMRTDAGLERIVKFASFILKRKGHSRLAAQFEKEYTDHYVHATLNYYLGVEQTDLGDHPPLSEWLAKWYDKLESVLGEKLMELLHLDDIKIFNYAVPVVFQPKGDKRFPPVVPWGMQEYSLHFVPFGGIVAYWSTWAVCVGATWGMGAVTFICSPIGSVSEYATVRWVAPPLSDWVYKRFNP